MLGAVLVQPFGPPWAPQPYGQASAPHHDACLPPAVPFDNDTTLHSNIHALALADRSSRAAPQPEQQQQQQQQQASTASAPPKPHTASPPAPPTPPPHSPFASLPTELHVALAQFLAFREQWALKRTSRYFHSVPELAAPASYFRQRHRGRAYQQALLVALSAAAVVRRGYEPCHACQRFRWKSDFELAQYRRGFLWCCVAPSSAAAAAPAKAVAELPAVWGLGGGGGGGAVPGDVFENGKFCIECGVAAGKYRVGETVQVVENWSDCHEDRRSFVIGESARGAPGGGMMVSEQGQEDLERKFNECGRFGCSGKLCGEGMTTEVVLDPTAKIVDKVTSR